MTSIASERRANRAEATRLKKCRDAHSRVLDIGRGVVGLKRAVGTLVRSYEAIRTADRTVKNELRLRAETLELVIQRKDTKIRELELKLRKVSDS